MLSRRQFVGGLALLLQGCGSRQAQDWVIRSLKQSLPNSLISQFRNSIDSPLSLDLVDTRAELFNSLKASLNPSVNTRWNPFTWFQVPPPPILITLLGADWLQPAIDFDLIAALDPAAISVWSQLPAAWQQIVRRDQNTIWGLPWRWGATAIAYNRRFVQEPITDWSDLWRPELRQKVTLPDHPREVIGLVLKSQGRSYNENLSLNDTRLLADLRSLHNQVSTYTSSAYLQLLRIEKSWVAVGWTEDLFALQNSYREFEIVIPASGSSLWYDLWVVPRQLNGSESLEDPELSTWIQAWLNLVINTDTANRIMNLSKLATVLPGSDTTELSPSLQTRPDLKSDPLDFGEFLMPLPEDQVVNYLTLWNQLRQGYL